MKRHGSVVLRLLNFTLIAALFTAVDFSVDVSNALAGEILKLKAGEIQLVDRSAEILFQGWEMLEKENQALTSNDFVIQFDSVIREQDRQALEDLGLEIKRYLPEDALWVRGSAEQVGMTASRLPGVRAVSEIRPEWKLSSALFSGSESEELVHVTLSDSESLAQVTETVRQIPGLELKGIAGSDLIVQVRADQILDLARVDAVEWIQPVPFFVTFEFAVDSVQQSALATPPALTGYESGTKVMNFEAAWKRGFDGHGQVAAMADTGLDTGDMSTIHPDFKDTLKKGYAMGLGGFTWHDPQGHGTHVSGSVVGTGAASHGMIRGGAHGAEFVAESMWSPILNNIAPGSDFGKLFGTPFRDGARIHTNSWGSPRNLGAYDSFASKVDSFMWENPKMLVLFAAGNSGEDANRDGRVDEGSISSPGTAKNTLTVGASENLLSEGGIQRPASELRDGQVKWGVEPVASGLLSDNPNGIAAFSSRGPTQDGRLKPEIVAPGTNIVSTRSHHPEATVLWGEYDENYVYAGGTSMATPLTAGAATVARQYLVDERGFADPSGALVKAALIHTAKDLFPGQYGTGLGQELQTRRPNVHEGYGRVDMDAMTALQDETTIVDDEKGVAQGEKKSIRVKVRSGGSLRITLTYTDAPAAPSAAKALVNDLDVQVVGPSRQIKRLSDRVNNTEMLELGNLRAGTYEVIVEGVKIPQGKAGRQPYALLVSSF